MCFVLAIPGYAATASLDHVPCTRATACWIARSSACRISIESDLPIRSECAMAVTPLLSTQEIPTPTLWFLYEPSVKMATSNVRGVLACRLAVSRLSIFTTGLLSQGILINGWIASSRSVSISPAKSIIRWSGETNLLFAGSMALFSLQNG